ncbi:MAG: COG1361 family protein [Methanothrix sp.]
MKSSPPSFPGNPSLDNETNGNLVGRFVAAETKNSNALQNVASKSASLLATVHLLPEMSQVYLENTGTLELHQVQIVGGGRSLGILSELVCGEKKVLAVSGSPEELQVSALDPTDGEVLARIQYISPAASETPTAPVSREEVLSTKAAPAAKPTFSGTAGADAAAPSPIDLPRVEKPEISALLLTITANKSEGRAGEVVGYRCLAKNRGEAELSDIQISCAGKVASTKYLPAGKELFLDGALQIENNTRLSAGVRALDARGKIYTNNTSFDICKISPSLKLEVTAPRRLHRGESVSLQIRIENMGAENLTDILVRDSFGEIERIAQLPAGDFQVLQKEMTVSQSLQDMFSVIAHDQEGAEVYASEKFGLRVLNSSLLIQGDPSEVRIYPGEPAEVTWILSNSGEELLQNITLEGDGKRRILKELAPGQSVKMAAIYTKNSTTWINVTAKGFDGNGFEAVSTDGVLLRSVQPGITLKAMPSEIEVCPDEAAEISVLITNSGDDRLEDVALTLNGSTLATLGGLQPGEFRVINSKTVISDNCTIQFEATGRDSRGSTLLDRASVKVAAVVAALKIFASSSPPAIVPGEKSLLTCTVANTGSVPLYSIFVISKKLGPLGNIEYLSPKRQMTVTAEKTVSEAIDDTITAEGFTQDKKPVRGTFSLSLKLLSSPGRVLEASESQASRPLQSSAVKMTFANISFGNVSLPFNLPAQEETSSEVSRTMASDVDRSATKQNNVVLDGIANLLRYVEKLLGLNDGQSEPQGENESQSHAAQEFAPQGKDGLPGSKNYELSIVGVKGSEHGAISILDVNALPSQPAANEPVKVTVHLQSPEGIKSASVKYGLSELPLTRQDMLSVDRVYDCALRLESGSLEDGYWSGTIPGRGAGTYMPLSVFITGGSSTAEGGPYLIHWSTVNSAQERTVVAPSGGNGMLFIESSSVKGRGEVSIKDTIMGSTMQFNEKIMGNGSISLETLRTIDRTGSVDSFTEKKDLVFTGGNLKGHKTLASPNFQGGMGASVTERFNLSHVDKSETSCVSSNNFANNTLSFKTDQAFDGTWNIQTKYAKFYKKIKADQKYTGSFQTQKDIKFQDAGQK